MKTWFTAAALSMIALTAQAEPLDHYQQRWAQIKYQLDEAQQEDAFNALREAINAEPAVAQGQSDYLIWAGIISSTYAGARGGLGALSYVKEARHFLEQALDHDANALNGSAYTSLGTLYYQVPGWPIGFGDDDKAEELLKKALAINPQGIDPNFFYGDFLYSERRYEEAAQRLNQALAAQPRAGRELADAGRRAEIQTLLQRVNAKLKGKKRTAG